MQSSGNTHPSPRYASFRVLVVEDEADVCALITDALTADGYEVVCAGSDAEAYAALEADPQGFAALIADINLREGTTGYDVARFARRGNPDLPVVYVTGAPERTTAAHAVEEGAFVFKPFAVDQLLQTLRERLER